MLKILAKFIILDFLDSQPKSFRLNFAVEDTTEITRSIFSSQKKGKSFMTFENLKA